MHEIIHMRVKGMQANGMQADGDASRREIIRGDRSDSSDAVTLHHHLAGNFPVAGLRIGYGALVAAMGRMLSHLSTEQREGFFWKNAQTIYRI
jgi:predicted TIM-barrel fold metal-dependent hydrolase